MAGMAAGPAATGARAFTAAHMHPQQPATLGHRQLAPSPHTQATSLQPAAAGHRSAVDCDQAPHLAVCGGWRAAPQHLPRQHHILGLHVCSTEDGKTWLVVTLLYYPKDRRALSKAGFKRAHGMPACQQPSGLPAAADSWAAEPQPCGGSTQRLCAEDLMLRPHTYRCARCRTRGARSRGR